MKKEHKLHYCIIVCEHFLSKVLCLVTSPDCYYLHFHSMKNTIVYLGFNVVRFHELIYNYTSLTWLLWENSKGLWKWNPHILVDHLTISQSEGGGADYANQITTDPRIFWPSYTLDWKFVKITATALKTSKSAKRCL